MSEVTAPPITITDFLNARMDERERLARLSNILVTDFWPDEDKTFSWQLEIRESPGGAVVSTSSLTGAPSPAEVLADIAAKRAILDIHKIYVEEKRESPNIKYSDTWKPDVGCVTCDWDNDCRTIEDNGYPCDTVRLLAQPYADHPDYRQEWKVPR